MAALVPAQDHKRIGEGDTGPNTGGMGVYSTDELLEPAMTEWILHHIAEPTIRGMAEEATSFAGVLYIGLMMTARGPQVLEALLAHGADLSFTYQKKSVQELAKNSKSKHRERYLELLNAEKSEPPK